MPNTYDITIVNESGSSQAYLLFAEVPAVAGPGKVFQNVFMTAPPIVSRPTGTSSTTFTITRQFYGICGTSIQNLAAGVKVSTSDSDPVDLGVGDSTPPTPGTTLSFTTNGGASFGTPLPPANAPAGAYTIVTDDSFVNPDPNNTFVGLGGMDMNGKVRPMATFLAAPNVTYNIFPVIKYYIATGSYTPGQIINVQTIGATQLVDFTTTTATSVTYIHNNHGHYVPASPQDAKTIKLARYAREKAFEQGPDEDDDLALSKPRGYGQRQDDNDERLASELQRVLRKVLSGVDLRSQNGHGVRANGRHSHGHNGYNGHY